MTNETSVKPVSRARAGTEAEMVTVPVEVAPSEPWVAPNAAGLKRRPHTPPRAKAEINRREGEDLPVHFILRPLMLAHRA